jgi:hypothetical protein
MGGYLYLDTVSLTDNSTIDLSGGKGGKGGAGAPAGEALGGQGAPPDGVAGPDSIAILAGDPGQPGAPGQVNLSIGQWASGSRICLGQNWWQTQGTGQLTQLASSNGPPVLRLSTAGAPFSVLAPVDTGTNDPFELGVDYRWVTNSGSLDVLLANQVVLHLDAPPIPDTAFVHADVTILDPALHNLGCPNLTFRLNGGAPSSIDIGLVTFRTLAHPLVVGFAPMNGGQLNLNWLSATNYSYQLQTRLGLAAGVWSNVGAPLTGTGGTLQLGQPIATSLPQAYYRLSASPR